MHLESFSTSRYQLDIELAERIGRISLKDIYSGVLFADSEYRYSAFIERDGKTMRYEGLYEPRVVEEDWRRGGRRVSISGVLGGTSGIGIHHRLYLPEDQEFLEERLVLQNLGQEVAILRGYRFGFRKKLELPVQYGGGGIDIEKYRLVAIPFRLQPDGKKHDYQLDDIYHGRYECSTFYNPARVVQEVVDMDRARSEGWAWTDGENGLLIVKYNPGAVEFSMLDTERAWPPVISEEGATEADGACPQEEPEEQVYLNFGGAAPSLYNEPIEARVLSPGAEFPFGKTRYQFYEGLWRQGAYLFREYMSGLGHGIPESYDPPVTWNSQCGIGWHHNNRSALCKHYTSEALEREAAKARDMGCELLHLGPGWEVCEGGDAWDTERLGEPAEFVSRMGEEYGLKVGFRAPGRSYCDDWPGMYRRRSDGSTGYYAPYSPKPFYEPCYCSLAYREEKTSRISKLLDAGMSFLMLEEFDWRGPCMDPNHGHPVPTNPNVHARAVADIICQVHAKHPDAIIEAHDPIWPLDVRYLPIYYMHGDEGCFDEGWAFDFAWRPLEDLLSGKALSLFYYNLAYSLPLYLHIDMEQDNDQCLAFWWYASTCRHIGIGSSSEGSADRFAAYKRAMAEYRSLKEFYARGTFYALDELTHIHVLPEDGRGVVNAFNLTDVPVSREVEIRLNDLGLIEGVRVDGAPHHVKGGKLVLHLDIPPFSPIVVKMARV